MKKFYFWHTVHTFHVKIKHYYSISFKSLPQIKKQKENHPNIAGCSIVSINRWVAM